MSEAEFPQSGGVSGGARGRRAEMRDTPTFQGPCGRATARYKAVPRTVALALGIAALWCAIAQAIAERYGGQSPTAALLHPDANLSVAFAAAFAAAFMLRRSGWRTALALALITPVQFAARDFTLRTTALLHPETADRALLLADWSLTPRLPWPLGSEVARWFGLAPVLAFLSLVAYVGLPLVLAIGWAGQLRQVRRPRFNLLAAYVFSCFVAYALYLMVPAAGPAGAFGTAFPFSLPRPALDASLRATPVPLSWARNCAPSMHLTWALLCWCAAQEGSRIIRAAASAFVVLTAMATLGSGQHYVVDLVVSFPFALALYALTAHRSRDQTVRAQWTAAGLGAALTLGWMAALRWGLPLLVEVRGLTATAALATVFVVTWSYSRFTAAGEA